MTLTDEQRKAALDALAQRRAHPPKQIDNILLPAGSDMYYYCESCGALADTKPEGWFLDPPRRHCGECAALDQEGLLVD